MDYFSLFSGIGGFELGIQQAYESNQVRRKQPKKEWQHERHDVHTQGERESICVGYSEIDKYAVQIYSKHFPTHKNYGNIRDIVAEELPDFGLLCGGFPCQSFSIAGKRGGFEDTRGTLFFDIARIAKVKRPRLLFLENVKGLLSHDDGRTFNTIIGTLDELGYDLQWQVLNSKNFGVPQNRERVFIIGHLRGTSRPQVFPFRESGEKYFESINISQLNQPRHSNERIYGDEGISPALNTMQGGNRQPKIVQPIALDLYNHKGHYDRTPTLTEPHHNTIRIAVSVLTPDRVEKRQNGRRFKEDGEESFTLTSQDKHGVFDGMKIRRLTPMECERLQGFPDGWTEEGVNGKISDSQRYKTLGNAVSVPVIKEIAKRLI